MGTRPDGDVEEGDGPPEESDTSADIRFATARFGGLPDQFGESCCEIGCPGALGISPSLVSISLGRASEPTRDAGGLAFCVKIGVARLSALSPPISTGMLILLRT